jgi:hypothetical protein
MWMDGWMRDYLSNCGWRIRLPFRHLLPFEGEKKWFGIDIN